MFRPCAYAHVRSDIEFTRAEQLGARVLTLSRLFWPESCAASSQPGGLTWIQRSPRFMYWKQTFSSQLVFSTKFFTSFRNR